MMERLSGDYNRGFMAGIIACQEALESVNADFIGRKKRMNAKQMKELLDCVLENRAMLREHLGFIRRDWPNERFEWFEGID